MRSLFTIHAGEYLVAQEIETKIKEALVWIPCKDTGIDLLVTNKKRTKAVSVQVKFSKDFTAGMREKLRYGIRSTGWWVLNSKKLSQSTADVWVFVLYSVESKARDFVVIKRIELINRIKALRRTGKTVHLYLTVNHASKVFETRDLPRYEFEMIGKNTYGDMKRNLSRYLNNWKLISIPLGIK